MKKIVLSILLLLSFAYSEGQNRFPTTDSLQNYILRYVKNSSVESFTNYRLQNILIGLSQMVDTLRQSGYVDSIWIGADDTLKYRIGNTTFKVGKISGGGSLNNQSANTVFAGPTSGSAAAPTFRALVAADIPDLSSTYATTTRINNAVIDSGWVAWSPSNIVGWSSRTTTEIRYRRVGKMIFVNFYVQGTGNTTSATTTGFDLPYPLSSNLSISVNASISQNNGAVSEISSCYISSTNRYFLVVNKNVAQGTWTASGTKTIWGQFLYEID